MLSKMSLVLNTYKAKKYSIIGNHDLEGGNTETLLQYPLGVLVCSGVMELLDYVTFGDKPKIMVSGCKFSYDDTIQRLELPSAHASMVEKGDFVIRMSHSSICVDDVGRDWYPGSIMLSEVFSLGPKWDMLVNGHIHDNQGIHYRYDPQGKPDKIFVNLGSISRGSIKELRLMRKVQILLVEFKEENGSMILSKIEPIDLKSVKPAEEVFIHVDKLSTVKKDEHTFVDFINEKLNVSQRMDFKEVATKWLDKNVQDASVREEVLNYVGRVQG
jgi:hypothetical protein